MTAADIELLLERYGAAWNGHDLDAILAEHTPDSVFHLHAGGPEAAPSGRQVCFDAVDLLVLEDGRIARKDTYADSLSLQQQLAEGVPAPA